MSDLEILRNKQLEFYNSGKTRDWKFRKESLKKLKSSIHQYKNDILKALEEDLGKGEFESIVSEILIIFGELDLFLKKGKSYSKSKKVKKTLLTFDGTGYINPTPYGVVAILSPWNYPIQLALVPLIAAVAAGNCVILKPSSITVKSSEVIKNIVESSFNEEHVSVVLGSREESNAILSLGLDKIFFTGSPSVGKIVLEKAAQTFTPCTLELGGKSPAIIDAMDEKTLSKAMKRILWGKFINGGQTCISPDYIIAHSSLKEIIPQIYKDIIDKFNKERKFHKIVNEKHYKRICSYLDNGKIIYGGNFDDKTLSIESTLMEPESFESPVMIDEVFGPIMPIVYFDKKSDIIQIVNKVCEYPLSLYLFSKSEDNISYFLENLKYGGACVNDTITHIVNHNLPFGGVRSSGMGTYHGYDSFLCFSRMVSVLKKGYKIDMFLRYPPYKRNEGILKILYKFLTR